MIKSIWFTYKFVICELLTQISFPNSCVHNFIYTNDLTLVNDQLAFISIVIVVFGRHGIKKNTRPVSANGLYIMPVHTFFQTADLQLWLVKLSCGEMNNCKLHIYLESCVQQVGINWLSVVCCHDETLPRDITRYRRIVTNKISNWLVEPFSSTDSW